MAILKVLKMQEKIQVLERMMGEEKLGAERGAPREGTEGGRRWGDERSSCEGTSSVHYAYTWVGSPIRHVTIFCIRT